MIFTRRDEVFYLSSAQPAKVYTVFTRIKLFVQYKISISLYPEFALSAKDFSKLSFISLK